MINYICNEIQVVFSPNSTAGKFLIFSLFLYLFLFFSEEKYIKVLRCILGVYYVICYIFIFNTTKNGSTIFGHGTTISKILSIIPFASLVAFYAYGAIIKRFRKNNYTSQ